MQLGEKSVDTAKFLRNRYVGNDPELIAEYERAKETARLAQQLYDMRTAAGLSMRELAKRTGTTASVICRIENASHEGHSLSFLRRVAAALGKRVEIRFVPVGEAE